jgi:hypothetical protein
MVAAEAGERRGRLLGQFILTDKAFLAVHELVAVEGSHSP